MESEFGQVGLTLEKAQMLEEQQDRNFQHLYITREQRSV